MLFETVLVKMQKVVLATSLDVRLEIALLQSSQIHKLPQKNKPNVLDHHNLLADAKYLDDCGLGLYGPSDWGFSW